MRSSSEASDFPGEGRVKATEISYRSLSVLGTLLASSWDPDMMMDRSCRVSLQTAPRPKALGMTAK